jgi:hypothetical protein
MPLDAALKDAMLAAVPSLRAFAISLSGNVDRADDLVQETLLRAMANINTFQLGTNMSAWLFTILRSLFRSEYRKRRREVGGGPPMDLTSHPEQSSHVEFKRFRTALAKLPPDQRRRSWSAPPASPTRRRPRSANARSARSRAGSIVRAPALPTCCRSRAPRTSVPTTRRARFSRPAAAAAKVHSRALVCLGRDPRQTHSLSSHVCRGRAADFRQSRSRAYGARAPSHPPSKTARRAAGGPSFSLNEPCVMGRSKAAHDPDDCRDQEQARLRRRR